MLVLILVRRVCWHWAGTAAVHETSRHQTASRAIRDMNRLRCGRRGFSCGNVLKILRGLNAAIPTYLRYATLGYVSIFDSSSSNISGKSASCRARNFSLVIAAAACRHLPPPCHFELWHLRENACAAKDIRQLLCLPLFLVEVHRKKMAEAGRSERCLSFAPGSVT